ncbi:MAG: hypothetical protein JWP69_1985 [Flaviaesturariibacter sp.]|nr:hypothetical protein [Flaviaesturariibacter sp.]
MNYKSLPRLLVPLKQVVIIILVAFFMNACRKTGSDPEAESMEPNAATAKEWYYGKFKKTTEWASSPLKGKKLPDWKNSITKEIGNLSFVEFPMLIGRKEVMIPSSWNLSLGDKKRITEATRVTATIIRNKAGKTDIRETYYIPTLAYLQKNRFDISHVSLLNADNDFSGQVVVRNWIGNVISIRKMKDGKITRTIKIGERTGTLTPQAQNAGGCVPEYECLFVFICMETVTGETITYSDCRWENTGEC